MDKIFSIAGKKGSKRFQQVFWVCLIANIVGIFLSGPKSTIILSAGTLVMLLALLLNKFNVDNKKIVNVFLWVCTLEICALSAMNNAVHDPMVIGFPLILIYAALFTSPKAFFSLLIFMSAFCSILILAILQGYWPNPVPVVRWQALVSINLLLAVAAVSSWIIASDFRQLISRRTRQILKLHRSHRKIIQLHKHDALTGLLTRYYASARFARLVKSNSALNVVLINIEKFKQVNDAFGHTVGDNLLKSVAAQLSQQLTENEYACRFGGDEFVLVLKPQTTEENAARLSQLITALTSETVIDGHILNLSVSVGVALYPAHADRFEQLCLMADAAMYKARLQRDCDFMLYQPKWQQEHTAKLKFIRLMIGALEQQQFYVEYQPKYQLDTLHIKSVEALVRWQSPELGLVSPARFIPLAEETGLIEQLGVWVLQQACADCQEWRLLGHDIAIAVNISAVQLASGRLPAVVKQVLQDTGLPPSYLELELTESMLMAHDPHIDEQINQLISMGLSFSIDDFGTGYSNLHYLSRFSMATVKIDQSFIRHLTAGSANYKLVQGIIGLAKTLGLHTIAEGIETEDNLMLLKQLGCDTGQGFLLSRPLNKTALFTLFSIPNNDNSASVDAQNLPINLLHTSLNNTKDAGTP